MTTRWATKTRGEREDEEAERLVRPLPKKKPPRKDRRREEMQVDRDPDVDSDRDLKGDPDLSLNYKNVGGSLAFRVACRFALGGSSVSHRVAFRQMFADAAPRVGKPGQVKVRSEESGWVGYVSEETLKEKGDKYQKVDNDEEGTEPENEKDDAFYEQLGRAFTPKTDDQRKQLRSLRDSEFTPEQASEDFLAALKSLSPEEREDVDIQLPKGLKQVSIGDIQKALRQLPPEVFKAPKAPKKDSPKPEPAKPEPAKEVSKPEPAKEEAPKEEAPKEEAPKEEAPKEEGPKPEPAKGEVPEKGSPEAAPKIQAPVRPKPSSEQIVASMDLINATFPSGIRGRFYNLHPDDVKTLVANYNGIKALGPIEPSEMKEELAKVANGFTLDPQKVKPPKTAEGPDGKEVSFEELNPEDQPEAYRRHQMMTVAENLATRSRVVQSFAAQGSPPRLAAAMADFSISTAMLPPEQQVARAKEAALNLFSSAAATAPLQVRGFEGISDRPDEDETDPEAKKKAQKEKAKERQGWEDDDSEEGEPEGKSKPSRKPVVEDDDVIDERFGSGPSKSEVKEYATPEDRKRFLASLDPQAQVLAVAHFLGEDYSRVREKYLGDKNTPDRISETDSASQILAKMDRAREELKKASEDLPEQARSALQDPASIFRIRVQHALQSIDPEKAGQISTKLAEREADEFETAQERFEEAERKHKLAMRDFKKTHAAWLAEQETGVTGKPEPKIPLPPVSPIKPPSYDAIRKPSKADNANVKEQLAKHRNRKARRLYSSYDSRSLPMNGSLPSAEQQAIRLALYQGVKPYPKGHSGIAPYPEWVQAQPGRLESSDFKTLLAAARQWLKSPVLAQDIEGMEPTARFQAALDLAIRDEGEGRFSSAIDPNLYAMMLASLSRKVSSTEEGSAMTVKFAKEEANAIIARLDKAASEIQANHKAWGMPFDAAKAIVNALDKSADEIEKATYGERSLYARQTEILKAAKVIQQDSDEKYMGTFNAPSTPKETDGDEPYMSLFKDDDTQGVSTGKSEAGRALAP